MEPCVSKKTSMSSFGDPSPGGAKAWTTLTNHFGALRSVLLRVGPSEFALPASIAIEVSLRGFAGRLALPECPQPSWNRLSPWQASWLVVRTSVLFREESSGHPIASVRPEARPALLLERSRRSVVRGKTPSNYKTVEQG